MSTTKRISTMVVAIAQTTIKGRRPDWRAWGEDSIRKVESVGGVKKL